MSVPQITKAAVVSGPGMDLKVEGVPIHSLKPNEILVDSKCAALAPTDYYHIDFQWAPDGVILGVGVSGEVLKVGSDVTRFKPGEFIASFIHSGDALSSNKGVFAKYAVVQEILSIKLNDLRLANVSSLPHGKVETFEGACSIYNSIVIAGCSLYFALGGSFDKPQARLF